MFSYVKKSFKTYNNLQECIFVTVKMYYLALFKYSARALVEIYFQLVETSSSYTYIAIILKEFENVLRQDN